MQTSGVTLLALAALVWKIVDTVKLILAKDKAAVTQAVAWAVGIGTAFVAANSEVANKAVFYGHSINKLDGWSLVIVGLVISSAGSVLVDFKQAFDNTDSSAKPPLLGPPNPPQ